MTILIPTLLQGAAMAFFFIPLQAIVFSGLQPQQTPSAAGLSNFVRITAGAVGTSLFTTLWESRASLHHAQLVESIHTGNATAMATLDQLMGSGMAREQALATIDRMINQQAFTLAVTDLFYLSAALFFVLVAVIWMSKPEAGAAADAGGAH
jgi:DHA2 family multidrug resistance protein